MSLQYKSIILQATEVASLPLSPLEFSLLLLPIMPLVCWLAGVDELETLLSPFDWLMSLEPSLLLLLFMLEFWFSSSLSIFW